MAEGDCKDCWDGLTVNGGLCDGCAEMRQEFARDDGYRAGLRNGMAVGAALIAWAYAVRGMMHRAEWREYDAREAEDLDYEPFI